MFFIYFYYVMFILYNKLIIVTIVIIIIIIIRDAEGTLVLPLLPPVGQQGSFMAVRVVTGDSPASRLVRAVSNRGWSG